MIAKKQILFLCTGNSCRSQMAEAWTNHLHGDKLQAYSAGVAKSKVDPRAIQVMAEQGIDISSSRSKLVEELEKTDFDYVITLCDHARESCPLFPGPTKKKHVGFDDPPFLAKNAPSEEEALGYYRRVRDEIRQFVTNLPQTLEQ
ncbi:arsenate reductase ArsC [Desulfonatronovibrio hydrogenovorans]|uniref:arsenate reductase ArsC n=1 Tax=Desulfonatronovibrio hydrogenovorans TaxID=53245 RepID=UPI000A5FE9C6|nr:arsenate reductase ArsC [Desulfonatronovibrio hydrogenovorans]